MVSAQKKALFIANTVQISIQCCFLLVQLFQVDDFLNLSESMVQMIMCRNLDVPEVCKFEAMLGWARNKIRTKASSKMDSKLEFKCIMERLARDLKLYRISPQELIKVCQLGFYSRVLLQPSGLS